jgi:hypothetical protein
MIVGEKGKQVDKVVNMEPVSFYISIFFYKKTMFYSFSLILLLFLLNPGMNMKSLA